MVMKVIEVDKNPQKGDKYERYSTKQKYQAVVLYKMIGNLTTVAKHMGIPVQTLHEWHTKDWWFEIEEEIRKESRSKLGKNLQSIVDKAFKEVQDRLENGDWIWDQKTGKMLRKPIGAHTANQILKDSLDKTLFLEKLAKDEKKVDNEEKIAERLLRLSEEFKKFTKAKDITGDAIHDEREERLQEGESPLQIETRTDQDARSTEQSTSPLPEAGQSA